jgi:hypothetical protein
VQYVSLERRDVVSIGPGALPTPLANFYFRLCPIDLDRFERDDLYNALMILEICGTNYSQRVSEQCDSPMSW